MDVTTLFKAVPTMKLSDGSQMCEINVNSEIATELLKFNTNNRPVRMNNVNMLKSNYESNNWAIVDEIMFDKNGTLINGQHRLIFASMYLRDGKTAPMRFRLNCNSEIVKDLDNGVKRSLTDLLTFNKVKNANYASSLLSNYFAYKAGVSNIEKNSKKISYSNFVSNNEYFEFYKQNENAIQSIVGYTNHKNSSMICRPIDLHLINFVLCYRNGIFDTELLQLLRDIANTRAADARFKNLFHVTLNRILKRPNGQPKATKTEFLEALRKTEKKYF